MARRPASVLAAMLGVAMLALPAVLLAGLQPAAAADGTAQQPSQSQAGITISAMTPQWATPSSTITVSGTVRNTSSQQARVTVQLLASSTPVTSVAQLELYASQAYSPATTTLPGAIWRSSAQLASGAAASWSIRVPASALGMTAFGVYPLAAQAESVYGSALATTTTYLPYEPGRKGPYASTRPSPAQTAWLWPLIDQPLLNEPWQDNCSGLQASALAQSLANGRLFQLVGAGALTQTTDSLATAAGRSRAAAHTGATPPQSLTDYDGVTWVVDPALLANVQALTTCGAVQPRWAKAASAWLAELKTVAAGQPLTATPYGDPNVVALTATGHGADVGRSFEFGQSLAGQILNRDVSPSTASGTQASGTQSSGAQGTLAEAAGIAWPAGGVPGYGTLESLANVDGVNILVLSSAAFPGAQSSVLKTLDGGGSYMTAMLASQSLTQLLGSPGATAGPAFATAQQFLAETALLAQRVPAQPIVVAPPQRWDPSAGLAADLLADTATAPWLTPVSLTSLASAKGIPSVPTDDWPTGSLGPTPVSGPYVLHEVRVLDRSITQLQSIRVRPNNDLYLAISAVESSAWQGTSKDVVQAMLATMSKRITFEQQAVQIIAEKRITLGGLKGSVPVSIDNRLGYAVKLQLQLQYSQASGTRITPVAHGLITVPPHTAETVRLRVQAAKVGSTTVTLLLASPDGQLLSSSQRVTIQTTRVGVLGIIICAAALGVFLIASAARALRHGRPVTGTDQPGDSQSSDDHDGEGGAERVEPDTVKAAHSELGAAGKPGP
jgi:Family of unknown function (DUF6049)